MTNIYVKSSQTLYLKTILPILIHIKGNIYFIVNLKNFFFKNNNIKNIISKNPTNFNIINPLSISYVSKIIKIQNKIENKIQNFNYTINFNIKSNSILICTTKDLNFASKNYKKFKKIIIVGYQHIPILGIYDKKYKYQDKNINKNLFFKLNNFGKILENIQFKRFIFTNLLYQNEISSTQTPTNSILIFHPGGYRNVISEYGDSKKISYKKQMIFFEDLIFPLLRQNYKIFIKTHPLHAIYHSYEDLTLIINQSKVLNKYKSKINILNVFDNYLPIAKKSKFNLVFGSSALYELWALGIYNNYICNYLNDKRSQKFNIFKDITINDKNLLSDLKTIDHKKFDKELKNTIKFYKFSKNENNHITLKNFVDKNIND